MPLVVLIGVILLSHLGISHGFCVVHSISIRHPLVDRQRRLASSLDSSPTDANTVPAADADADVDDRYYESFQDHHYEQTTTARRITLSRYLDDVVKEQPELANLRSLVLALRMACKSISNLVNRANLAQTMETSDDPLFPVNRLGQLSTLVLKNSLRYTGKCRVTALHDPDILVAESLDSSYVACLDPLDGSSNASICTGTIFGIFKTADECDPMQAILQPAQTMVAAGYCLYSSATVLVLTLHDNSVQAFTLDPQSSEFVLMNSNLRIPSRGTLYSCNEANAAGWEPRVLCDYIHALKTGTGTSQQRYSLRYVGSMVGDVHRTLLHGGIFLYPSDAHAHPQGNLGAYKTSPLAVICERAGGAVDEWYCEFVGCGPHSRATKVAVFFGESTRCRGIGIVSLYRVIAVRGETTVQASLSG